eukprot:scaffold2321_cov329-Prasinococcus_capsulatus_cf.AAC.2
MDGRTHACTHARAARRPPLAARCTIAWPRVCGARRRRGGHVRPPRMMGTGRPHVRAVASRRGPHAPVG